MADGNNGRWPVEFHREKAEELWKREQMARERGQADVANFYAQRKWRHLAHLDFVDSEWLAANGERLGWREEG